MSDLRFGRTHRRFESGFAQCQLDGGGFQRVVKLRARPMQVRVLDLRGQHLRVFQRHCHGARSFIGFAQSDAMKRFARRAVTRDFSPHFGAARLRVFAFFNHEHPRAFAQNKAVAIRGKRSRSPFRRVVPMCRNRAHQTKTRHHRRRDARIRATADNGFRATCANHIQCVTQRIAGTGAAIGNRVRTPAKAVRNRDLAGNHAGNRTGNRVGRKMFCVAAIPTRELFFGERKTAAAAAHHDVNIAFLRVTQIAQTRGAQSFVGRGQREGNNARHAVAIFF